MNPSDAIETTSPVRVLPEITEANEFFWTSGADGNLRFLSCSACGVIVHPPAPVCPVDLTPTLSPTVVSGMGYVRTFTINRQQWLPGFDPPYVIALVELAEQRSVRLTTNIVNCAYEKVTIGMQVRVLFAHQDDVWIPLFEPAVQ